VSNSRMPITISRSCVTAAIEGRERAREMNISDKELSINLPRKKRKLSCEMGFAFSCACVFTFDSRFILSLSSLLASKTENKQAQSTGREEDCII
jgi:hypothetical protein